MKRLAKKEAEDPCSHWRTKVDALENFQGGRLDGFIDTSAGVTYADKASHEFAELALDRAEVV